jgi:hypothetical protein
MKRRMKPAVAERLRDRHVKGFREGERRVKRRRVVRA